MEERKQIMARIYSVFPFALFRLLDGAGFDSSGGHALPVSDHIYDPGHVCVLRIYLQKLSGQPAVIRLLF